MAYTTLALAKGNDVRQAPMGFSWTVLFFGFWPALFRRDWLGAIVMFFIPFAAGFVGKSIGNIGTELLAIATSLVVTAFLYNTHYARRLINSGYKVTQIPDGYTEDHIKHKLGFSVLPMFHQV